MMEDNSVPGSSTNSPGLPELVTQEKIVEAAQTQTVLEKRQVGKLLKGDTTPDVHDVEHWTAQNTVSTLVTKFEKGQPGQHLYIKGDGFTTLQHGIEIFMTGAVDMLLAANQVYHFVGYAASPVKFYQVVDTSGGGGGGAGVTSFNGRNGVVVPIQADYDSFFLTPAEGNALYSLLGHTHPAADIVSGVLNTARLGGGVANATKFLRGDSTWQVFTTGTIDGAGSAGFYAKWVDADTLTNGNLADAANNVQHIIAGAGGIFYEIQPGNVAPGQSAANPGWMVGSQSADGKFIIRSRFTGNDLYQIFANESEHTFLGAATTYVRIQKGTIIIQPQDNSDEGGELILKGGPNGVGVDFIDWSMDNFQGRVRWYTGVFENMALSSSGYLQVISSGGAVVEATGATSARYRWVESDQAADERRWDFLLDSKLLILRNLNDAETVSAEYVRFQRGAGTVAQGVRFNCNVDMLTNNTFDIGTGGNYPRFIGCATGFTLNGSAALDFTGAVLRIGNSATWTQLNLMVDNTARWHLPTGGMFVPVANNTYDIGTAALQVRDMFIAGEVVSANGTSKTTANQAAFNVVQTNITNGSFAIGATESWIVRVYLPLTMVGATGVKFYWTGPAGIAGNSSMTGTGAALTTVETVYTAALTVPATFLARVAGADFIIVDAEIRSTGTAGTVQLVGITQAVGVTCVVKAGMTFDARRIS